MVIDRYKNKEEGIYLDRSLTDIIKMISCLMVAIHHYAGYAISRGYSDSLILKAFSTQGGYLGVALFFFLSGYGLMKSEQKKHLGFKDFARKRFGKVFIPVLLVTAIWLPIYWFLIGGGNMWIINHLYVYCGGWVMM